jgi:signal peptidase II
VGQRPTEGGMRFMFIVIGLCVLIAVIDQLAKWWAVSSLMPIKQIPVIDGFFSLTYVENSGAAFGAMQGARWFFVILTFVLCIAIFYVLNKREKKKGKNLTLRTCVVLVVGGAFGNLADRIFRGTVVDYLDFNIFGYNFPVFNIADICVVCGGILIILWAIFYDGSKKEKKEQE